MVTPICVGGAELGSTPARADRAAGLQPTTVLEAYGYEVAEDRALATLRAVFDGPLNFLDTAANYGDGESERRIGLVLRERGGLPPGSVLATKADRELGTNDFSAEQVQRSVERSLGLLGLDRLQLVYLHDPEFATRSFEQITRSGGAVDVLHRFKAEGVIDHVGIAGGLTDLLVRYVETGQFEVLISHNRYTLLNREADALWEVAAERGVAAVNAAAYGGGILSKGPEVVQKYRYRPATPELLDRARRMAAACARYDVPLPAAALQFSLRDPRVSATIVGFSRPERLQQTLDLAALPIPDALWRELDAI